MSIDVQGAKAQRAKSAFRLWSKQCLQKAYVKDCRGTDVASYRINAQVAKILQSLQARKILLYTPFGFESDSKKLLLRLRKQGKQIFIPYIMEGIRFKVLPLRLPLSIHRCCGLLVAFLFLLLPLFRFSPLSLLFFVALLLGVRQKPGRCSDEPRLLFGQGMAVSYSGVAFLFKTLFLMRKSAVFVRGSAMLLLWKYTS